MPNSAHLKFNDPAPDLELQDVNGAPLQLASLWQTQVLILAFTRHFGCPQCKEMVDQLGATRDQAKNLALAIVTQGLPSKPGLL
jgi:peroxiredoxin